VSRAPVLRVPSAATRLPERPRVIFDANVSVQALAFDTGPAAEALRLVDTGRCELYTSTATLRELRRVLAYDEIRALSPNLTRERIAAVLKRLVYRSTLLRRVRHVFDFPRDRRDEPYLDLAAAAKADYLVTRDKDMLWLMTGHTPFCKQFRQRTHPLRVLNPVNFLNALRDPDTGRPRG